MKVGFVGTGNMGTPMALNILKCGHQVVAYNRTPEKAVPLRNAGATVATSLFDLSDVDILMTVIADGAAEQSVLLESGLIDGLSKQTIHVSCTTVGVEHARQLTAEHKKRGRTFVMAPVLGRAVDMAAEGKLFVIAAGPAKSLERCAPLFEAVGQRTFVFGEEPVSAVAAKLAINFLVVSSIEAMSEAFALTSQYGVRRTDFYEFFTSTLFATPIHKAYGKLIEQDNFVPANFVVPLGLKDVKMALDASERVNLAMPVANVARDHLIQALAQGYADHDWSVIGRVVANALVPPRTSAKRS